MPDIATEICSKALKLDSSYRPVEVIDSLEALVLCLCGKAIVLEAYEKTIRSVSDIFQLPMFWLKNVAPLNILPILVTDETSQFEISLSNEVLKNILFMLVTEETSQPVISPSN